VQELEKLRFEPGVRSPVSDTKNLKQELRMSTKIYSILQFWQGFVGLSIAIFHFLTKG